jgi:hypothetical protein
LESLHPSFNGKKRIDRRKDWKDRGTDILRQRLALLLEVDCRIVAGMLFKAIVAGLMLLQNGSPFEPEIASQGSQNTE